MIDRTRLRTALAAEIARFEAEHPRSRELFLAAQVHLWGGVPMNWMSRWSGSFPLFHRSAGGARVRDVDGCEYIDFCLGDTGAMSGHSPAPVIEAVRAQMADGITLMLPNENALRVATELARRFGLPCWQTTLTATDANRFAIRLARLATGRTKILVMNGCYHGTVDETFATLVEGEVRPRAGNLGPPVDPALTTKVVEFNDIAALGQALAERDVACVLAEPAMTNVGIILPEPGYHEALRRLTCESGTLLILDETHTFCAGPGGYTSAHGLAPDFLTIGKAIGSGVPAAAFGFTREVAAALEGRIRLEEADTGGIGGTLAGNALSLAVMRATLDFVLTEEAFSRMIPLAERWASGVEGVIAEHHLPWIVKRLGCRAEYWFRERPPRNGAEAMAAIDPELDRFMHLAALNRGILMTPFHNMALMSPVTTDADVDRHTAVFRESVALLA